MSGEAYLVYGTYAHDAIADAARAIREGDPFDSTADDSRAMHNGRIDAAYLCEAVADAVKQLAYVAAGDSAFDSHEWLSAVEQVKRCADVAVANAQAAVDAFSDGDR